MAVAGDLVVNITGRTTGLRKASGGAINLLGRVGLAAQGLKTIFQSLKAAVSTPIKLAADLETTAISMEVLVGNARHAKIIIGQLNKFSTVTPFSPQQLTKSATTLLAMNVAVGDVVQSVKRISDIAAGSAEKLGFLTKAFGDVRSAGRLTGQEVRQFVNTGFNPLQEISKRTGESMLDLKKRMEAGKVSFEEVRQSIIDATSAGGRFAGMNKRLSKTTAGIWSTLKGNISFALADIGKAIIETFGLKSGTKSLNDFIAKWKSDFLPAIKGVLRLFRDLFQGTMHVLRTLWNGLFGGSGEFLKTLVFALRNADLLFQLAGAKFMLFGSNLVQLFRNIGTDGFEIFKRLVFGIAKVFRNLFTDLLANAKEFGKALVNAIKGKGFNFQFKFNLLKDAREDFAKVGQLLGQGFKATSPEIQRILKEIADREQKRQAKAGNLGKLPGVAGGNAKIAGATVKQGSVEGAIRGTDAFFKRLTEIRRGGTEQQKQTGLLQQIDVGVKKVAKNTKPRPGIQFDV